MPYKLFLIFLESISTDNLVSLKTLDFFIYGDSSRLIVSMFFVARAELRLPFGLMYPLSYLFLSSEILF